MRRRQYLAVVGAGVMAGCAGVGGSDGGSDGTGEQSEKATASPTQTPTASPTPERTPEPTPTETEASQASVEAVASEVILADSVTAPPDGQIPWAHTEVKNAGAVPHGRVRTEIRFYDSDETLLEVREGYTDYIPPQTTWSDYIRYFTETPEKVDAIQTRVVRADPQVDGQPLSEISVVSSEISADPEASVELTAEIALNSASPDRVTVLGLFYDAQGTFRGTVRSVETNPGDTIAVSTGTISIRTPPNLDGQQIVDHEIVVLKGSI